MIDTLQEIVIVVGLAGVGLLWVGAVLGMLQVGWKSIIEPIVDRLGRNK